MASMNPLAEQEARLRRNWQNRRALVGTITDSQHDKLTKRVELMRAARAEARACGFRDYSAESNGFVSRALKAAGLGF